jgi:hypothetical protein
MYGSLSAMCKSRTGGHLGKFPVVRRNLFSRRCNFNRWLSAAISQVGQALVMVLLMCALWRISALLVLNRSLLNREYILINVLKTLAEIISMRNLHVTFLSKITPRYFTLFTNGMFRPFSVICASVAEDCEKSKFPESYIYSYLF